MYISLVVGCNQIHTYANVVPNHREIIPQPSFGCRIRCVCLSYHPLIDDFKCQKVESTIKQFISSWTTLPESYLVFNWAWLNDKTYSIVMYAPCLAEMRNSCNKKSASVKVSIDSNHVMVEA